MTRFLRLCNLSSALWVVRQVIRSSFTIIKFPGVIQLVCFGTLYHYAERMWCEKFCGVWEPAFPKAWTIFILILVVIPIFATIQLLWLLGSALLIHLYNKRKGRANAQFNGGVIAVPDEEAEYMLLEQVEGELGPQPPQQAATTTRRAQRRTPLPSIRTIFWWTQVILYSIIVLVGYREYTNYENEQDTRFRPALQEALAQRDRDPAGYGKGEKIFFAAAFYNNQDILPYWTQTLLDTIAYLGSNNVFVSIVENNSNDRTPELLRQLDDQLGKLGVQTRILIQDNGVQRPEDMAWNNRIEFLAAIRNRALEPLVQTGGYDKVVFSNDIYIEPESLIELIETANGDYDMACAMDFGHFGPYDMWVLRDRIGHLTAGIWPYFFDDADYQAMKTRSPVPVFTCWNGIVAFQADPVLPLHLRSNRTLSTAPLRRPPPVTHPLASTVAQTPAYTPPLYFRSSPRGEGCFSSESFLLPYDMRRIMGMERIYVNPRVITAYAWHFYVWHKWVLRHRIVSWFVESIYNGAWMQYTRMIVGDDDKVYAWDGGDCHPWWYGDWW